MTERSEGQIMGLSCRFETQESELVNERGDFPGYRVEKKKQQESGSGGGGGWLNVE